AYAHITYVTIYDCNESAANETEIIPASVKGLIETTANTSIANSNFANCTGQFLSGIYTTASVAVYYSEFFNLTSTDDHSGGAAINAKGAVYATDSLFHSNSAAMGGAVWAQLTPMLSYCEFINNTATKQSQVCVL
ncbi:hypothetical protein SARC_13200, partial [Sphaeroforma arctica JP610]